MWRCLHNGSSSLSLHVYEEQTQILTNYLWRDGPQRKVFCLAAQYIDHLVDKLPNDHDHNIAPSHSPKAERKIVLTHLRFTSVLCHL